MKIRSSSFNSSTVNRYTYEENHCRVTPPLPSTNVLCSQERYSLTLFTQKFRGGGGRQVDFKDYF